MDGLDPKILICITGATAALNIIINWIRRGVPTLAGWAYLVLSIVLAWPIFASLLILTGGPLPWPLGQTEIATLFIGGVLTAGGAQIASAAQQSGDEARAKAKARGETPDA